MSGVRSWWLVTRRLAGCRRSLLVVLIAAMGLMTGLSVLAGVVSASAAPQPGELNARLLGAHAARVQADDAAAASAISAQARRAGLEQSSTVLDTPVVLRGDRTAVAVQLQIGDAPVEAFASRLRLLSGTWPTRPGQVCLSEAAATASGITVGDPLVSRVGGLSVACVLQDRVDHTSRAAYALGGTDVPAPTTEQARAATHYLVFAGGRSTPPAEVADLSDVLQRRGYSVLTAGGTADDIAANDGEVVSALRSVSWLLLPVTALVTTLLLMQVVRSSARDLRVLVLVGWTPRLSAALAGALVLAVAAPALVLGGAVGTVVALSSRSWWERVVGAQWYEVRISSATVVLLVLAVVVVPVVLATAWANRQGSPAPPAPTEVGRPVRRMARASALAAVVTAASVVATERWTYLLLVAVLAAPALAAALDRGATHLAVGRGGGSNLALVLRRAHSAASPTIGSSAVMLLACIFAFPATAILMISGIEGGSTAGETAIVPRPSSGLYVGAAPLGANDAATIASNAGARLSSWRSVAIRRAATLGTEEVVSPLVLAAARRECTAAAPGGTGCTAALNGVGTGHVSDLEALLGRSLSPEERSVLARGGVIATREDALSGTGVAVMPASDLSVDTEPVSVPAVFAPLPPGTVESSAVPVVLMSSDASAAPALPLGTSLVPMQARYLFEFPGPVTPVQEELVRRGVVSRAEVGGDEEFLLTRLDVAQVGVVRRALDRFPVLAAVLAVGVSGFSVLMLRRDTTSDHAILEVLGVRRRTIAAWFVADHVRAAALAVGATLAVSAVCASLLVRMEVHSDVPASAWASLWFLGLVPVFASLVALLGSRPPTGAGRALGAARSPD